MNDGSGPAFGAAFRRRLRERELQVVDPADTRECDGYPGLAPTPCPCGDPADCSECP